MANGEFFVLLGSSGCGKTTTLRMIAGLEHPTSGRVVMHGRDVTMLPPRDRDIAMVFQDYGLYPHLSVYENIRFPLRVRGIARGEHRHRVEEVAGRVKIAHLLGRKPTECSGGEKQRIALARALVRNPKLFLMDEPLSNLDAKLRLVMRGEIKQLASELGITTVYVTHDQSEAMALATRIAVMSEGRLIQVGSPLEIYDAPATLFVAGFIGSPPMNFLPGTINGSGIPVPDDPILAQLLGPSVPCVGGQLSGQKVQIGIRPEHLELATNRPQSVGLARVELIEPLGQDTLLHIRAGASSLLVTTRNRDISPGQLGRLSADPSKVLVIDAETEQTIFARGEIRDAAQI